MRNLFLPIIFCCAGSLASPSAECATLDGNVLGMFPKNVAEFAYADLSEARKFSWYPQFRSQSLPTRFSQLETFLQSTGVDTKNQIEQVAWALAASDSDTTGKAAPDADNLVGVFVGTFNNDAAEAQLAKIKARGERVGGFTLYSCGGYCPDLYVAFVDPGTIAFGQHDLLVKMLRARSGGGETLLQNEAMFKLVARANGGGIFWGVLNAGGSRQAVRKMAPQVSDFPEAAKLLNQVSSTEIHIDGSSELEARLSVAATSSESSATLSQLIQAGILLQQYQVGQSDPALAAMLQNISVTTNGPGIEVAISASNDQILNLLNRNAFSSKP